MDKTFLDTDVCLDVMLNRQPFSKKSSQLLLQIENNSYSAFVSTLSFNTIFYVLRKKIDKKKAVNKIKKLRAIVNAGKVNKSTLDLALNSGWPDFEDALQHFCAVEESCQAIITRNTGHFKKSELPVFTPAQFLREHL